VLQRNDTAYAHTVMGDEVRRVEPGETADLPGLLDGWTEITDDPEPEPTKAPAKTKQRAAADTDGGEPQ
jgi:hypothetical protein